MAKTKVDKWLTNEGLTLLKGWARDGLTDIEIAHNMGIKKSSLYVYKNKYSDIMEALKEGKEVSDYIVENSLYKRANGFLEKHITQTVTKDGDIVSYEETTYYPPNPTAMIYWLNNRKKEKWRNSQNFDIESSDNNNPTINVNIVDNSKLEKEMYNNEIQDK